MIADKKAELELLDVAIVGGGMVGLTLACALGGSGIRVGLIDPVEIGAEQRLVRLQKLSAQGYDARVSALNLASQQILQSLGAWSLMAQQRLSPYRQMQVWDGEGTAEISFSAGQQHRQYLGHIVENRVTVAALHRVFEQHDNLCWYGGVTLSELGSAEGTFSQRLLKLSDGRKIQAQLVVAADGALSKTRELASVPLGEWDYQQHALVTTVETEQPHQHTAWQRFTEDGPLALLPLPGDGHQLSIVWSTSPDHARELMELDDAGFAKALEDHFESRLGRVTGVDKRHLFPLRQRHAQYYVDRSLALVGDAAHTIHPLAGQGVNLGLLDAAVLAEELLACWQQELPLGDKQRLRRYQRRRQGENMAMMGMMAGLRHLYARVPPALQWLRNLGMQQVNQQAWLKRRLVDHALGLEGDLPEIARLQS